MSLLKTRTTIDGRSSDNRLVRGVPLDLSFQSINNITDFEFEMKSAMESKISKQSPQKGKLLIEEVVSGLKLNNNDLSNLDGFRDSVLKFTKSSNLQFLDLSFNKFDEIHDDIASFENLTSLYLTGNDIRSFRDVRKLKSLKKLRSLSLHGCPVTSKKDYKLRILHIFPTLHKLDFTAITRADRDRVSTWAKIWGPQNEALMESRRLRATARGLEREKNSGLSKN